MLLGSNTTRVGDAHAAFLNIAGRPGAISAGNELPEGNGLAAAFSNDVGITSHPSVISADNFNSYTANSQLTSSGPWDNFFQGGNILLDTGTVFEGARSVRLRMPSTGAEVSNALIQSIPDSDTVFLRVYTRFASNYTGLNSAHNGLRISGRYAGPGNIPNGVTSGPLAELQNVGNGSPGNLHAYVYYPEQDDSFGAGWFPTGATSNDSGPDGGFGDDFVARPNVEPTRGVWICHEFMLKLNTPGQRDGRLAAWQDGELIADWQNLRFRDSTAIKLDEIQLENGGQGSTQINDKWYDNVVVATEYIGPKAP